MASRTTLSLATVRAIQFPSAQNWMACIKRAMTVEMNGPAFRDAECEYDADRLEGGTMALVVGDSCWLSMTARRVRELRFYLQGPR